MLIRFNRPGVAKAVLQIPLSLIHSFMSESSFLKISSKHCLSQTVIARELKF